MTIKLVEFDEGWNVMLSGFTKLKKTVEELPENRKGISVEEYMLLYSTVYNMGTQKHNHAYSQQLYEKYKETFEEYNHSTVLPAIREKHGEVLLRELVSRWESNKLMILWMSRFFQYLERYFIPNKSLPCLKKVGIFSFHDQVYRKVKDEVQAAVISLSKKLSEQEKEGEQVDRALLDNVQDIIVEMDKDDPGRVGRLLEGLSLLVLICKTNHFSCFKF